MIDRFGPRPKTTKLGKRHDFRPPVNKTTVLITKSQTLVVLAVQGRPANQVEVCKGPQHLDRGDRPGTDRRLPQPQCVALLFTDCSRPLGVLLFMSTYVVARALALPNVDIMACLGLAHHCSATDFLTRGSCLLPFAFAPGRFPLSVHFHNNET